MEWFGLGMPTMCLKQSMGLESGGIASMSDMCTSCIYTLCNDHLCNSSPISARQWGILPKRSTSSPLLCVMHDW